MKNLLIRTASAFSICSFALTALACSTKADSSADTSQVVQTAPAPNPDTPIMVRGTVTSVSANQVVLKSDTGAVTVALTQPFHLYSRVPAKLARVTENSFIGVTTVKQPDGSERATEIHVFPEELRGLGEGSRMMGASPSRMTNGNVSQSRMTNGNVSSTNGSSLVVQYAGGSQNVTVPPNTPVTELKLSDKSLAVGDQVAVLAKKAADGSISADKAVSTAR